MKYGLYKKIWCKTYRNNIILHLKSMSKQHIKIMKIIELFEVIL